MIIVSGLSGSGKSIVLQTLEDLDYYCVDNLPLELVESFARALLRRKDQPLRPSAVSIDARNFQDELSYFPSLINELRLLDLTVEVVFLEASDEALLKRYSETRRRHPLSPIDTPLLDAIRRERLLLQPIKDYATVVVDTSYTNVHELRQVLRSRLCETDAAVALLFQSFAYKNGVPEDIDFVFDVRCLPNPHWDPQLRPLTGLDERVIRFLAAHAEVAQLIDDIERFLATWIPHFESGPRSYMTIAIGCTGGQHRSVYVATELAARFEPRRGGVIIRHREL